MRLFLSSYRLGPDPSRLLHLVGVPGRALVVANAADGWPDAARQWAVRSEFAALGALGFDCAELDLRRFVGRPTEVRAELARCSLVWVRGGNTFVLRTLLARSGADTALRELLAADAVAYGGYSAGACVLAPSLRGLELVDDPAEVGPLCGGEPLWDGLGLVPFRIVPHYRSPGHEHPERIEELVQMYRNLGVDYRALADDEVIVIGAAP